VHVEANQAMATTTIMMKNMDMTTTNAVEDS